MSWLGIGISTASTTLPMSSSDQSERMALLQPSTAWTGVAGSGFETVPNDPVRLTAKPALRLLTPPFQHFTDTLEVGVMAFANDGGTLIGGIDRVRFHFEGASIDVVAPHLHSFVDLRGVLVSYIGYWVKLKRPSNKSGSGRLYAEAIPADATMQKRVIGPFTFSPSVEPYDASVTVNPDAPQVTDVNYQTLAAAMTRARSAGWVNPLITITKAGTYSPPTTSASTAFGRAGYCNITASVPGVVLGYPSPPVPGASNNQDLFATERMKVHLFGVNLTLDFANFAAVGRDGSGAGFNHWLDGITVTNSNGRGSFFRGALRSGVNRVQGATYFTECNISNLNNALHSASLVRGCTVANTYQDCINGAGAVIDCTFESHDSQFYNSNEPAFSVQYTGAEATATIARRGAAGGVANADGVGMYRVTIGSTNYDFVVGDGSVSYWNGSLGDGFWFADVVDWLNTLPDVTATLLIATDREAASGSLGPENNSNTPVGTRGQGWGFPSNATKTGLDIKTSAKTITSFFDLHSDWVQHASGTLENIIVSGNRVWDCGGQIVFLAPTGGAQRDVFFVNNGFHRLAATAGDFSGWGRGSATVTISHCVLAHNSWAGQGLLVDGTTNITVDAYTLFKNNALPFVTIASGWASMAADNNHLTAGATPPAIGTNWSTGGASSLDFYVDADEGDFTPAGALLGNLRTPVVGINARVAPVLTSAPVGTLAP